MLLVLAAAGLALVGAAGASSDSHVAWSYSGDTGPTHWGSLSPDYAICDTGLQQSPIDIAKWVSAPTLQAPVVHYAAGAATIVDNGHTIQAQTGDPANHVTLAGHEYELHQVHFHVDSEHTIRGRKAPLELHFVNIDASGNAAVIGLLVQPGRANRAWQPFVKAIGSVAPGHDVPATLPWPRMAPRHYRAFTYPGSLTTPGCAQIVTWFVAVRPITMSQTQIDAFAAHYDHNTRPVQPLDGRVVQVTARN